MPPVRKPPLPKGKRHEIKAVLREPFSAPEGRASREERDGQNSRTIVAATIEVAALRRMRGY